MGISWLWRKEDSSPASFEKTLSALSTKINTTQTQLDKARSSSRRIKVLGTLYLGFAYLAYAIVLTLVVGWKNAGAVEWTGAAAGPLLIYLFRTGTQVLFSLRIDSLSSRLKDYQTERAKTIQKLKDATRYDSTLQLLEKYGGSENRPRDRRKKGGPADEDDEGGNNRHGQGQGQAQRRTPTRTNLPPPATANIQRAHDQRPATAAGTPQPERLNPFASPAAQQRPGTAQPLLHEPSTFGGNAFAHNALLASAPPAAAPAEPHWYDRILDTLLGEDETAAKNRIVLICGNCRLVNGQAPPGTKSLSEMGRWKCMACQTVNGEMDEGERIVRDVLEEKGVGGGVLTEDDEDDSIIKVDAEEIEEQSEQQQELSSSVTEGKGKKGKGKKGKGKK